VEFFVSVLKRKQYFNLLFVIFEPSLVSIVFLSKIVVIIFFVVIIFSLDLSHTIVMGGKSPWGKGVVKITVS